MKSMLCFTKFVGDNSEREAPQILQTKTEWQITVHTVKINSYSTGMLNKIYSGVRIFWPLKNLAIP